MAPGPPPVNGHRGLPGDAPCEVTSHRGAATVTFGLRGVLDPAAVVVAAPRDAVLVLAPRGEVDAVAARFLRDVLVGALSDTRDAVVVDLAGVAHLGPEGVLAFLRAHRHARENAVALGLARPPPAVRQALEVETARALVTGGSVDEVVAALAAGVRRGTRPGGRRHDEYAHLAPLFAELQRLAPHHPHREAVRAQLITGYLPVARNIARRHAYRGENLDDLEQVAVLGLINAVDRFDPARGTDFLSFAVPTINGEVQRHYRDRTSSIRVPRPLHEVQVQVGQLVDEMSQRLGRAPTPRQLAARLDLDVDTVVEALQAAYETRPRSLDEPRPDDDPHPQADARFAAALGAVDRDLDLVEYRQALAPLLDRLAAREREIVLLRFYGNLSQSEIAGRVGISQMHVSRLLAATLAKLRRHIDPDA